MSDLDIIRQLETELDLSLPLLDESQWNSRGYTLNEAGAVTGMHLDRVTMTGFISTILFLAELASLRSLSLSRTEMSDLASISSLSALTNLDLVDVRVGDLNPLENLTALTSLSLSGSRVGDLSPIAALHSLISLDLSATEISDFAFVEPLTELTSLNLSSTQITDLAPLLSLTDLKCLYLDHLQLDDLSPVGSLTELASLSLILAQANNLSIVSALSKLESLNLSGMSISDLNFVGNLIGLESLSLSETLVNELAPIRALNALTALDLSFTPVRSVASLESLTALTSLSLSNTWVDDLNPIRTLTALTFLDISFTSVRDLTPLRELTALGCLNLSFAPIFDLTPLDNLIALTALDLRGCSIEVLPAWICDLEVQLSWQPKEEARIWLVGERPSQTDGVVLGDNPLKIPPPEIVQQGMEAVRNYFEQLATQENDYLFEAKLLIVGEPGAGKTTMARKLADPASPLPGEDETTRGIHVQPLDFPLQAERYPSVDDPARFAGRSFRLNLWDFGGQEIYKATHRFFLSRRSVYALVADSRNEDTDFNYWLHAVEMFGGDSPLIIVLNEKLGRKRSLDTSEMKRRFGNIVEVCEVDFAEVDQARLQRLKQAVEYHASGLLHIGSPVPMRWTDVRQAIKRRPEGTISRQDYLAICRENGIEKTQDALVLSQYFHDIGVFLHFQDDDLLAHTLFLKPNWATDAVYRVLDHPLLGGERPGRFSREDVRAIWPEDEFELIRNELLRLMQRFYLIYEVDGTGEYIVPAKLPAGKPDYPWNGQETLQLRYVYGIFMPEGILSQLTVQLNRHIRDHDLVWRRGVVLERSGCRAEIIEGYATHNIVVRVTGRNHRDRRELMTIIREQLDQINGQFDRLQVKQLIPCNCAKCTVGDEPYFYEHGELKSAMDQGVLEVQCRKSWQMVSVPALLDAVFQQPDLRRSEKERMMAGANPPPKKIVRDKVFVSYSHKDKDWLARVQTHLAVLKRRGISIDLWDDTKIRPGMRWRDEIAEALATTRVAILLITTDFLASEFITEEEIPPLLAAAEEEGAKVLSVIVKPSAYKIYEELSAYQAANDPSKPLSKMTDAEQDEVLVELTLLVDELMKDE